MSDIWVVFIVVLISWLGLAGYFLFLHNKTKELEKTVKELQDSIKGRN
ncbi:MAG: hypothetical protein Kow00108_26380 [Calditrichia bacterium]